MTVYPTLHHTHINGANGVVVPLRMDTQKSLIVFEHVGKVISVDRLAIDQKDVINQLRLFHPLS